MADIDTTSKVAGIGWVSSMNSVVVSARCFTHETPAIALSAKRMLNRSQIGKLVNDFPVSPGVFAFGD